MSPGRWSVTVFWRSPISCQELLLQPAGRKGRGRPSSKVPQWHSSSRLRANLAPLEPSPCFFLKNPAVFSPLPQTPRPSVCPPSLFPGTGTSLLCQLAPWCELEHFFHHYQEILPMRVCPLSNSFQSVALSQGPSSHTRAHARTPETFSLVCRRFWRPQLGEQRGGHATGISRQRPGVLLNFLQCTGELSGPKYQ